MIDPNKKRSILETEETARIIFPSLSFNIEIIANLTNP